MRSIPIRIPRSPLRASTVRFCDGPAGVAAALAAFAGGDLLFLVTDRNVARLHGKRLERLLLRAGTRVRTIVLPPGERSKSRKRRDLLEDAIIRGGAERGSVVAALGGGVVGDLAGFAAATVFRGLRLAQIPTTLVAQVDSAIGGKTGIDHPRGKNLLGAFHHPELVLANPGYLATLPEREFRQGLAEAAKYALVMDRPLRGRLLRAAPRLRPGRRDLLAPIVARCASLKASVVTADERESGLRRILNFGHTVGHALEHASRYRLRHGEAVAIGMAVEARISVAMDLLDPGEYAGVCELLASLGLPLGIPRSISHSALLRPLRHDKKRSGGGVRFTLLRRIGSAVHSVEVPPAIVREALRT